MKKAKTIICEDTCTPMFTAAIFAAAKIWKQPVSINIRMDKGDVIYTQ